MKMLCQEKEARHKKSHIVGFCSLKKYAEKVNQERQVD